VAVTFRRARRRAVVCAYYEIRVAGLLPPGALGVFEQFTASVQGSQTVLHGPLEDQAALRRLVGRLETFGAPLLEVHRLADAGREP
jgi:hypothetical protein